MNRTTVYRNLTSMERAGLLERDEETKTYTIGAMAEKMYQALKMKK